MWQLELLEWTKGIGASKKEEGFGVEPPRKLFKTHALHFGFKRNQRILCNTTKHGSTSAAGKS